MFAQMMRYGDDAAQKGSDSQYGQYYWGHHPMMWGWAGNNSAAFWLSGILWWITWILVIVALVAVIRWLWKKGDKVK